MLDPRAVRNSRRSHAPLREPVPILGGLMQMTPGVSISPKNPAAPVFDFIRWDPTFSDIIFLGHDHCAFPFRRSIYLSFLGPTGLHPKVDGLQTNAGDLESR